jgi:hypothetical protein
LLYYVQLWKNFNEKSPTHIERVEAPSEGHAVVQLMRKHRLTAVDRAWVHQNAYTPPTLRLIGVFIKGKIRSWRVEQNPLMNDNINSRGT